MGASQFFALLEHHSPQNLGERGYFPSGQGIFVRGAHAPSRVAIGALADGIFVCAVGEAPTATREGACAPRKRDSFFVSGREGVVSRLQKIEVGPKGVCSSPRETDWKFILS